METKLYTTADVAAARGVTPTSVARVARGLGIGRAGRDWVFTQDEFERVKNAVRSRPGNPYSAKKQAVAEEKTRKKTT